MPQLALRKRNGPVFRGCKKNSAFGIGKKGFHFLFKFLNRVLRPQFRRQFGDDTGVRR
jgi:hypothetical protein